MQNLQTKSHEALLRLLNNIGIIGAVLAAVADILFVVIMVVGVDIHADMKSIVIFAVVNAFIGILINVLLRYQGQKYAEIENEDLCKKYYNKRVKEKKYMSMTTWMTLKTMQDFIIKGATTAFSVFGVIYITIKGSKNPIQLLITLATLVLFACFGLIGMNAAYGRYYSIQVPHMQQVVSKREEEEIAKAAKNAKRGTKKSSREAVNTSEQSVKDVKRDSNKQADDTAIFAVRATFLEPGNNTVPDTPTTDSSELHSVLADTSDNAGITDKDNDGDINKETILEN